MSTDTDIQLRSRLDTNQRDREQMCRAILALDPHYADVRPRHPTGGRDGGRDIEAIFDNDRIAYGAVGFTNSANDSSEQKKRIRKKYSADLKSALVAKSDLKVFVFFTNVHLTVGEKTEMESEARQAGIAHLDVFDRERLRIELDSPSGFFVRFQYLRIPLSEAEQASFLARYGDRIQEVVSTGFERIERTLGRILFLQESADVLDGVSVCFHLKRPYAADEINHFRAFVTLQLRAVKHDILSIWFGSSDKPYRFHDKEKPEMTDGQPGIGRGTSNGQWETHLRVRYKVQGALDQDGGASTVPETSESVDTETVFVGAGWSIGIDPVSRIVATYGHDDPLIRFRPRLTLRDLDECMFMPMLNLSLAEKLHSIEVFANGYKLADVGPEEFVVDNSFIGEGPPGRFTPDELADPWVRIRPLPIGSAFHLRFTQTTPKRVFDYQEARDRRSPTSN